ncbi:MAG: hypothetical protein P4L53_09160 [Candidatus Obscuribacterales bacterium]|nr:hypothetical protein [Candidatus Obscuribacterales bacterium]
MREHQITITLQAEQFQEIQRLARTAGARSVGTYAREKLLAAVGLNLGSKNLKATRAQDLTSVTGELKRLHRELQIFIAESLSAKDYGYIVNGQPQADLQRSTTSSTSQSNPDQESATSESAAVGPLKDYGQNAKEAEELAERAFIISPRLGAIEEVFDEPMDFSDPLDELLGEYDEAATPLAASSLLNAMENQQTPKEEKEEESNSAIPNDIQKNEELSTSASGGEIPHSVFDAELAAFQNQQKQLAESTTKETPKDTTAPVSPSPATAKEEGDEEPAVELIQPDEDVNSGAQTGIQEEGSEIDFQNRPPLSGGPPPRKRRT